MDGSPSALEKLSKRLAWEDLNAKLIQGDFGSTGLPEHSFDAAVDIVSIAHNVNYCEIIEEVYRLLKPGGKLFSVWPTSQCYREPYRGKGPAVFLTNWQIHKAFQRMFTLDVGWVKEEVEPGCILDHWIIHGTRSS